MSETLIVKYPNIQRERQNVKNPNPSPNKTKNPVSVNFLFFYLIQRSVLKSKEIKTY
jgi:hypothetical protein